MYGLNPDRLYVTYFEGDPKANLQPDLEAKQLWREVGVPEDHILPGSAKDNFWGRPPVEIEGFADAIDRNGCYWPLWTL